MTEFKKSAGGWVFAINGFEFIATKNEAGFAGRAWSVEQVTSGTDGWSDDSLATRKAAVAAAHMMLARKRQAIEAVRLNVGDTATFTYNGRYEPFVAGVDCGADYCVDPGNCAKHDPPADLKATIEALASGDTIEITSRLGSVFTATYVGPGRPYLSLPTIHVHTPSVKLPDETTVAMIASVSPVYRIGVPAIARLRKVGAVTISQDAAAISKLVNRERAIAKAYEAIGILKSPGGNVREAELLLNEAANAAHWSGADLGAALGAALDRGGALRGSTSPVLEVPAGAGESYADHAPEPKTDARGALVCGVCDGAVRTAGGRFPVHARA